MKGRGLEQMSAVLRFICTAVEVVREEGKNRNRGEWRMGEGLEQGDESVGGALSVGEMNYCSFY